MSAIGPREQVLPGRTGGLPSPTAWIGLCAAAEAVGMAAAAVAAKAGSAPGVHAAAALALVVGGGLVEGIALGVAQATGLRGLLPKSARRAWVLVTVVVAGLGWAGASAPAVLAPDGGPEPPVDPLHAQTGIAACVGGPAHLIPRD